LSGGYGTSGKYRLYHVAKKAFMTGRVTPNHAGGSLKFVVQRYSGSWHTIASGSYPLQSNRSPPTYFYTNLGGTYRGHCIFGGDADQLGSKSTGKYFNFS
jgi:hypothetical protein